MMLKQLSLAELRRFQIRQDQELDEEIIFVVNEIKKVYQNFFNATKSMLSDAQLSDIPAAKAAELFELANQLDGILVEAGLEEAVANYQELFPKAAKQALGYFEAIGVPRSRVGLDIATLEAAIELDVEELVAELDRKLLKPLKRRLISNVVGSKTGKQIASEIKKDIDAGNILRRDGKTFTDHNVETLMNESVQRFRSKVRQDKAAALNMDIVYYRGPNDKVTRDSCKAMLSTAKHGVPGMYYTDEVTTALHPDLTQDPLVARGGFNCRHEFMPITAEFAESMGFDNVRKSTDEELENAVRAEG